MRTKDCIKMNSRHPLREFTLFSILAIGLSGCALANVAGETAPELYVLSAPVLEPLPTGTATTKPTMLVGDFAAPAAIDTTRILYQPTPNEVKYYAGARWTDSVPKMVHGLLVETLDKSGGAVALDDRSLALKSEFELVGDIRRFGASPNAEGKSVVDVAMIVRLVRASDRSIVDARSFEASATTKGSGMKPVIAAFDEALGKTVTDITAWAIATASTAK